MQQLFQRSGSRGPDTGDRRKLGGVSIQQIMQTAKSRTYSTRGNPADAWQGQYDLHLLLGLSSPAPSCRRSVSRGAVGRVPDLALLGCRIDQVRRIYWSATGQDRHAQDSCDVGQRPTNAFRTHLGVTDALRVPLQQ